MTPGPWKSSRGTFAWFVHHVADDMQLEKVARDISTEEDARLIAAAPDLLTACQLAAIQLERHSPNTAAFVREAIAKAESQEART